MPLERQGLPRIAVDGIKSRETLYVESYVGGLVATNRAKATATRYRAMLPALFKQAMQDGQVPTNPVRGARGLPHGRGGARAPQCATTRIPAPLHGESAHGAPINSMVRAVLVDLGHTAPASQ